MKHPRWWKCLFEFSPHKYDTYARHAERWGVSPRTVSRWHRLKQQPRRETQNAIKEECREHERQCEEMERREREERGQLEQRVLGELVQAFIEGRIVLRDRGEQS